MNDLSIKPAETRLERRAAIQHLEDVMMDMETAELPVFHHFADKLYARELHIPADTALVGKVHRTTHINILAQGRIVIVTEDGGRQELEAPQVLVTGPGTKRVGYTLTDTVWITVHGTEETDLEKLEHQLIAPSHEALEYDPTDKLTQEDDQEWLG